MVWMKVKELYLFSVKSVGRKTLRLEYSKMADLGVLSKSALAQLRVQFWSRGLRRNVVWCLRFKRILMKISWHLRRTVFQAPKVGLRFGGFPLVPPLQNFRKWAGRLRRGHQVNRVNWVRQIYAVEFLSDERGKEKDKWCRRLYYWLNSSYYW